jgi:hypothetical protein
MKEQEVKNITATLVATLSATGFPQRAACLWQRFKAINLREFTMKRLAVAFSIALLAVACSSDRSITITEQNKDSVLDQIKDSKSFTPDEVRLLMARRMRVAVANSQRQPGPDWVGKTLAQVIEDERKLDQDAKAKQAEVDRLAAEAKAKQDAMAAELRKAISLAVYDKGFIPSDIQNSRFDDYITVKCAYENVSGKDVRAFTGAVRFADLFDKEIMEVNLTIQEPIKASDKATWNGTIKYNQFMDDHQSLKNAELANMKITWIPKSIIFADGSKLGES